MVPDVGAPVGWSWWVVSTQWDGLMWARRAPVGWGSVERNGRKVRVPASSRRLVLLVLASRMNRQGRCWPTIQQLTRDTGLSWDQTQRAVQSLVEDGWVGCLKRPNRPSLYILAVGRDD